MQHNHGVMDIPALVRDHNRLNTIHDMFDAYLVNQLERMRDMKLNEHELSDLYDAIQAIRVTCEGRGSDDPQHPRQPAPQDAQSR